MKERQKRLLWADLVQVYLWHAFPKDALVTDDQAWVSLLRMKEYVEFALSAIEAPAPVQLDEEQ